MQLALWGSGKKTRLVSFGGPSRGAGQDLPFALDLNRAVRDDQTGLVEQLACLASGRSLVYGAQVEKARARTGEAPTLRVAVPLLLAAAAIVAAASMSTNNK